MRPAIFLVASLLASGADFPWSTTTPEQAGFRRQALDAWKDDLAVRKTTGLVLVRDGKIVYEWYAMGWDANRKHYTASTAKMLVGGMSLLVAMQDGRISPDDAAAKYIVRWRNDPRKSKITIRHLATHTSGIQDANQEGVPHEKLPGWMGLFWKREPDPFSISLDQAPVLFDPGTRYHYSNPGMAALAYAVTASLRGAPQQDLRSLLHDRVYERIGIPGDHWSMGYGRAYELDSMQLYANWGGGNFTARAMVRVGQLLAQHGVWNGRPILDAQRLARATAYARMPKPDRKAGERDPASGLGFYTNEDGAWPAVPRDAIAASGAGNQFLVAVPSLNLVCVRQGEEISDRKRPGDHYRAVYEFVLEPLLNSLDHKPPYPPSQIIRSVSFAPESNVIRKAIDSDNWPITWGEDDSLYTSYGDGRGFEPYIEPKLSLGYARITGRPDQFEAVNIRSESGERSGDGAAGAKSSGMVMIGGVLYQLVRNVGNSQLMWSEDRGRTWQWGFKFETSFASPSFINYGRNYGGAPDDYVYVYSQDGPSAYEPSNQIVLARVPKARIRDRQAYQFFVRLDSGGRPVWASGIASRGPVFSNPGRCERTDAVFHPVLKRYLLAVSFNHRGAWGIFDAPNPWGPWTTTFHTNDWGLGSTHGYRLPSKWISADGRSMTLVFSGRRGPGLHYDAFCARQMTMDFGR